MQWPGLCFLSNSCNVGSLQRWWQAITPLPANWFSSEKEMLEERKYKSSGIFTSQFDIYIYL